MPTRVRSRKGYHTARRKKILEEARAFLGGACVSCGETERLEFDHVDYRTKKANVAILATKSKSIFWAEVAKCQLLCYACHKQKTAAEAKERFGKNPICGTRHAYDCGCRCEQCRAEIARQMREWRWKTGRRKRRVPKNGQMP